MTNVDEWTNDDTGVGAAIAAGSHAEKGIWALLVIAASRTQTEIIYFAFLSSVKLNELFAAVKAIAIIRATSPTRLLRTVNIPAPYDLVFW